MTDIMGKLSKHFSRFEFACRCGCGFNTVDWELLEILEQVHEYAGAAVRVLSGCRCLQYNRIVGSKDTSQHVRGRAADVTVKFMTPEAVYIFLNNLYPGRLGLGLYKGFVHVDTRSGNPARW